MHERFELSHAAELQPQLAQPRPKNVKTRRSALRKVVSNMIVNNQEMQTLYPEILNNLDSSDSEIKRMCLLYLETYVKSHPRQLPETLQRLSKEVRNEQSPTALRAVALRTLSNIPSKAFAVEALEHIPAALRSEDPYFRKTACYAVAKAWAIARSEVESSGELGRLNMLLIHEPSPVVAAAVAQSLLIITDQSKELDFIIDFATAKRLASMISDCPEFAQISLLSAIMKFVPNSANEAGDIARLVKPGLRHTNAAVAMGTARVMIMLSHYSEALSETAVEDVFGPLLSQLNRPSEIQYCVLRNIQLLLQTVDPDTLGSLNIPPQLFLCKVSDLAYIRATKIDILSLLCNSSNSKIVMKELIEFVHLRIDPAAQRRAIHSLAKLAAKYESIVASATEVFIRTLNERANAGGASSHADIEIEEAALQELIYLVRSYPDEEALIDQVLAVVSGSRELPKSEEPRCSFIWFLGTYAHQASDLVETLLTLVSNFKGEKASVQLALMTACMKTFFRFPRESHNKLIPQVLEAGANGSMDPDVRDRSLLYWRLVSQNPAVAEHIVSTRLPAVAKDGIPYDYNQIEDLELSLGNLSSIYLKPADRLFRLAPTKQLGASPALLPRKMNKLRELALDSSKRAVMVRSLSVNQLKSQPAAILTSSTGLSSTESSSPSKDLSPRTMNLRQSSLMNQYHDSRTDIPMVDDPNEKLIDI